MTRLVLGPDGSALATQVWGDDLTRAPGGDPNGSRPPQAVVIDLKPSPPRVRTTILDRANQTQTGRSVWGHMVWLNADRLGFFPAPGAHPRAHIFDSSLRELGGFDNWAASTSLLVGEVIIGLGQGRLTTATLPNGPTRVVEQLQSSQTIAMAALAGATQLSPPPQATQPPAPPPGPTPVSQAAPPAPPGDADLPILPFAATAAAMVLLAGLFLFVFGRARRRSPDA
jgi:hypothetical protein